MDEADVIAREIRREARRELRATAEQLRFEGRDRAQCVVCGAELQAGRCPWSKVSATPSSDGKTYCTWPKVGLKGPSPAYRFRSRS
jgi:hypothetical protein